MSKTFLQGLVPIKDNKLEKIGKESDLVQLEDIGQTLWDDFATLRPLKTVNRRYLKDAIA